MVAMTLMVSQENLNTGYIDATIINPEAIQPGANLNITSQLTLSSGAQSAVSDAYTVTINEAAPENQPPIASDDTFMVDATEDGSWTFSLSQLEAGDFDPDGTFSIVSVTSGQGTVTGPVDGEYVFTPTDASSVAPVTLSYTIEDDDGAQSSAVATVAVTPYVAPNQPPVADDVVTFTMAEDGTLTISEADLLGSSSDPDNDVLHIENLELGEGASGTLTLNDESA